MAGTKDEETATTPLGVYRSTVFELHVLDGATAAVHRMRVAANVVIGRAKTADVRIEHPTISRQHARLEISARIAITDLDSQNGTRVDGVPLTPDAPHTLAEGQAFELGAVKLVVRRAGGDSGRQNDDARTLHREVEALEKARIVEALGRVGGNQSKAALELGISRRTLRARMAVYGLPRPRGGGGE
jgi:pSer/pThr/pTyr-binding forkhead associated (FHA) protein